MQSVATPVMNSDLHARDAGPVTVEELSIEDPIGTAARRSSRLVLYVTSPGSDLSCRADRVIVSRANGEEQFRMPLDRVARIVLIGDLTLSSSFIHQVMRRNIDVVVHSSTSRYLGRVSGDSSPQAALRRSQYALFDDPEQSLAFARVVVRAKLENQRALLMRHSRRRGLDIGQWIEQLRQSVTGIDLVESVPELLGVEGAAARAHFAALRVLLPDWGFDGRHRRPPTDPINILLSFGYSMLTREVESAVRSAGLDPATGFLHAPAGDRPSLAFDMVEEWRPVLVDSVVLRSIGVGRLRPEDFSFDDDGRCRMSGDARTRFIEDYEHRMLTMARYHESGRKVTYREALSLHSRQLASVVRGEQCNYRPVSWR